MESSAFHLSRMASIATNAAAIMKTINTIVPSGSSGISPLDIATRQHKLVYIAYIGAGFLLAVMTWLFAKSGDRMQDIIRKDADARIEEAKSEAAKAKSEAAKANERAEHLERDNLTLKGNVAILQTDASNAKAAQQTVEIELDKQKTLLSAQQERTTTLEAGNIKLRIDLETEQRKNAEAQQAAAEAQLALRRNIAYSATPRRINIYTWHKDQDVRDAKFKELKKYAGTTATILFVQGDKGAKDLAFDIKNMLLELGFKADATEAPANISPSFIDAGVRVLTLENADDITPGPGSIPESKFSAASRVARAVVDLLSLDLGPPNGPLTGVSWRPDFILGGEPMGLTLTRFGIKYPEGGMVITVGEKPTWDFFIFNDIPQPSPKK